MKKLLFIYFAFTFSITAQNFVLGGNYFRTFNNNWAQAYTCETLLSFNDNMFAAGLFLGLANIMLSDFNDLAKTSIGERQRGIWGIVTYYNPFIKSENIYINPFFIKLRVAKISEYSPKEWGAGGSDWNSEPGFFNSRTKDDYLINMLLGYRVKLGRLDLLLEVGWHHRNYFLTYDRKYYDDDIPYLQEEKIEIPKTVNAVLLEFGFQLMF